ncbi:MAG: glutathione transferase GstA, partial [Chromatiales bacterium]
LTGIDLAAWPVLAAYRERIQQRPAVQAARKAEGLKA